MGASGQILIWRTHNTRHASYSHYRRSETEPQNLQALDLRLAELLSESGCKEVRLVGTLVCAVQQYNFTTAVVVGLSELGHERRYCYEHGKDARAALAIWDGSGHPPGPWIKCKGAGIDLLNPDFR